MLLMGLEKGIYVTSVLEVYILTLFLVRDFDQHSALSIVLGNICLIYFTRWLRIHGIFLQIKTMSCDMSCDMCHVMCHVMESVTITLLLIIS